MTRLLSTVLLIMVCGCSGAPQQNRNARTQIRMAHAFIGETLPTHLWPQQPSHARYTLVWAFRTTDCYSCGAPTWRFRHLALRLGDSLRFVAAPVGMPDSFLVAFLKQQRLPVDIVSLPSDSVAAELGSPLLPAIYLFDRDTLVASWLRSRRIVQRRLSAGASAVVRFLNDTIPNPKR